VVTTDLRLLALIRMHHKWFFGRCSVDTDDSGENVSTCLSVRGVGTRERERERKLCNVLL
jgi:hypothetical protein